MSVTARLIVAAVLAGLVAWFVGQGAMMAADSGGGAATAASAAWPVAISVFVATFLVLSLVGGGKRDEEPPQS